MGGEEARRNDNRRLALGRERKDDVLNEDQINCHLVFVFVQRFGNARKEALVVGFGVEVVAEVAEIQFEGRVRDDVIEGLEALAVAVVGVQQGVALNDVLDGMDKVVEDQVQAQHSAGFLRNILRVNGTAVFADLVCQTHQQRARTRRGVVDRDVLHLLRHHNRSHDLCHRMRRVILGILSAAVLVVILDEILEDGGEEIELLGEDFLETEFDELVDERATERIALARVCDGVAERIEQLNLRSRPRFNGEDLVIGDGDVAQGVIEKFGKFFVVLAVVQVRKVMMTLQLRAVGAHAVQQGLVLLVGIFGDLGFPVFGIPQFGVELFHLIPELVVHEFIQEGLGDDLELIARVAESVGGAHALEAVDELFGLRGEVLNHEFLRWTPSGGGMWLGVILQLYTTPQGSHVTLAYQTIAIFPFWGLMNSAPETR